MLALFIAYKAGQMEAKGFKRPKIVEQVMHPVKAYQDSQQEAKIAEVKRKLEDYYNSGWQNIFSYDGTSQEKAGGEITH